ncbi:auxin-induced in root cultures protein 12-like [Vicia villosa]|uniref:auxin-induced in root cultures protein 12-like n=1 Tax=Vicia villosa TaxID=3911 RepID=UPI00273BD9A4|nr:auxin-induced in root cultures protein 12-like [Vicia villosa]
MASSSSSLLFSPFVLALTVSIFISLFPTNSALTCATQKLSPNHTFANCTDLPTLGATLHYTYNDTTRAISVAYSATPPENGWVAWGINPTGGKMVGTQALVAFKNQDKVQVQLSNISSYGPITATNNLSVATSAVSGEEANGVITIFATVILPEKTDVNITQVWQVGPVVSGRPAKHGSTQDNLNAFAKLSVETTAIGGANSTTGGGNSTAPAPSAAGEKSGGVSLVASGLGFVLMMLLSLITM